MKRLDELSANQLFVLTFFSAVAGIAVVFGILYLVIA